jgi:hypothetical protein
VWVRSAPWEYTQSRQYDCVTITGYHGHHGDVVTGGVGFRKPDTVEDFLLPDGVQLRTVLHRDHTAAPETGTALEVEREFKHTRRTSEIRSGRHDQPGRSRDTQAAEKLLSLQFGEL